ncbi:MAG: DUF99 family protein [Candidatus Pacearchaeota archaeon]
MASLEVKKIKKIKHIKPEIRILGIDDGHFEKFSSAKCLVVGTIFRGAQALDGLISFYVEVDGDDGTEKLIEAVNRSKHKEQLSVIMINGIALGGFNVLNIKEICLKTGIPVVVVSRKKPRIKLIKAVLKKIGKKEKIKFIEEAGKPNEIKINGKSIYFQCYGLDKEKASELIKSSIRFGNIPEPLRVAHIIATGIVLGENKGRV